MSLHDRLVAPSIQDVLSEFASERRSTLDAGELAVYRRVLFFLELCINNYGHRNLDPEERALCERLYHAPEERHFFEIFGPDKLLFELDFFASVYVRTDVFTSRAIEERAAAVVEDLTAWLVERGHVSAADVRAAQETALRRRKLRSRASQLARLLSRRAVVVDPHFFTERDYIALDDHAITRIDPGRLWLRVYRGAEPFEVGPLLAPLDATKSLRVGWTLSCALARIRGRWCLAAVDEVYPRPD